MKLTIDQKTLAANLEAVARAVSVRPTHPILGNVLIKADQDNNTLTLSGFDLTLGIECTFPAEVIEGGDLTLPARLFADIVNKLPQGKITLEQVKNDDNQSITVDVITGSSKFQIRGLPSTDFPDLPSVFEGKEILIPVESLTTGLNGVLFAASNDDTKQILTGVNLSYSDGELIFAATDGHRLSVVNAITDIDAEDFNLTLPGKVLQDLVKLIEKNKDENLVFKTDQDIAEFSINDQKIISRRLDGNYPNYETLIPQDFSHKIIVDRKRLLKSVQLIGVMANKQNNLIVVAVDTNQQRLMLSTEDSEIGSAKESIEADIDGDGIAIAFKIQYLIEALKTIPSNEIIVELTSETRPAVISPLSGLTMTCLLMPVEIRS